MQSVAPAAQRAGANKRSAVCRQNVVLFQVRCRMKKDNPFGLSFFGYHIRNSYNFISIYCPSFLNATCHSLTILSNLSYSLFIYNENYFGPTCLYNVSSGCSTVVWFLSHSVSTSSFRFIIFLISVLTSYSICGNVLSLKLKVSRGPKLSRRRFIRSGSWLLKTFVANSSLYIQGYNVFLALPTFFSSSFK